MTVLESHHKKESLLEITNFLNEMTCSTIQPTSLTINLADVTFDSLNLPHDLDVPSISTPPSAGSFLAPLSAENLPNFLNRTSVPRRR